MVVMSPYEFYYRYGSPHEFYIRYGIGKEANVEQNIKFKPLEFHTDTSISVDCPNERQLREAAHFVKLSKEMKLQLIGNVTDGDTLTYYAVGQQEDLELFNHTLWSRFGQNVNEIREGFPQI